MKYLKAAEMLDPQFEQTCDCIYIATTPVVVLIQLPNGYPFKPPRVSCIPRLRPQLDLLLPKDLADLAYACSEPELKRTGVKRHLHDAVRRMFPDHEGVSLTTRLMQQCTQIENAWSPATSLHTYLKQHLDLLHIVGVQLVDAAPDAKIRV